MAKYYWMGLLIGVALLVTVGFTLNLISCIVYNNWWPIFVVIAYFFVPIPNIICGGSSWDDDPWKRSTKDLGYWFTGFLVVCGFGLPLVLAHSDVINWQQLVLSLCGALIVYTSMVIYIHFFKQRDEDY